MEEFVENFCSFRTWLYNQKHRAEKDEFDGETDMVLGLIIKKFEELELNDVF